MAELEFEEFQHKFQTGVNTLKAFLKDGGVACSTYNFWSKKVRGDTTRNCIRVKNRRMPNGTYGGVRGR